MPAPAPFHDPEPAAAEGTHQHVLGRSGDSVVSVSNMIGPFGVSTSVACRRHGCCKLVGSHRVMFPQDLKNWLLLADEDPECTTKAAHLQRWDEVVRLAPTKRVRGRGRGGRGSGEPP